mgnify:CR=1 FL=1
MLETLRNATIVDLARHLTEFGVGIVEELVPVKWHAFRKQLRDLQLDWLLHSDLNAALDLILNKVFILLEGS